MTGNSSLLQYAFMRLTRDLDARFESLLLTGRVSKWYSAIGTEATTVPAGLALLPGDVLCTLHRDLGAILTTYLDPARTFPGLGFGVPDGRRPDPVELLERLACQLLGKGSGFSKGFERSFHYGYLAAEVGIQHVGMISHLGAMIPVAAGCAFALKQKGSDRVALNFIGDGGTSTGDFHEGLNMAAVWRLPLVLIIENNRYAFSTPAESQYAVERLSDRGRGYGIAAESVDGKDPDEMAKALARAFARARSGGGPTLIEAILGRMRGHSEGDDSLKVVPKRELDAHLSADPVAKYAERLHASGVLDFETQEKIEKRCNFLIEAALESAIAAAPPDAKTAWRPALAPAPAPERSSIAEASGEAVAYVDAIRLALTEEMELDDRVILLGQDIGRFEGAFRVTRGLHDRWPRRVLDTPIAESGTLGIAIGAALLGYRVVVEMQFADFVSCGFNQIVNVAAKLFYRWHVPCPIVIRLPSGGGVGAGPFHSQNPEAWFTHVAGLKVVCPASAQDARALLKAAIRDPNPVIFCEHKFLYRRVKEKLPGEWEVAPIGSAVVRRAGTDLTLIAYGASTWTCLEAAERLATEGVGDAEVIDLRSLVPLDWPTIEASVSKTSRVVVVHEAPRTSGFGAEVVAEISERAFAWLDAPVMRVTYPDLPVPYARNLEQELFPNAERVVAAAKEVLAY